MSRIGKKITLIPNGVTVSVADGVLTVQGPKGTLTRIIHPSVTITVAQDSVTVSVQKETVKFERSLWGTFSAHVANMVKGVTVGYKKQLEINGVGYRVAMQGTDLKIDVGFSHPVIYKIPTQITASVEKNVITLEGIDKDVVGQVAAEIRAIRKPEPYKGKGIKYMDEQIRRKAGKTAKA
jgi:large subunit ribosomal protein L6